MGDGTSREEDSLKVRLWHRLREPTEAQWRLVWGELVDRNLVGECLGNEPYTEDDLLDDARDLLRIGRAFARVEGRRLREENGDAPYGRVGVEEGGGAGSRSLSN